jgi:hypothetical protein
MSEHGTASEKVVPGWYVEFQLAALRALPRDLDQETADRWRNNGELFATALRALLFLPKSNYEIMAERAESLLTALEHTKPANLSVGELLRLISGNQVLVLDATKGNETFSDAKDVFDYIDPDFKNWDADGAGQSTSETPIEVYEMAKNGTFSQMFSSLCSDVRRLCFTPGQVKNFVRKYRGWLRTEGYGTFFLFEANGHFFVALVLFHSAESLDVRVDRFGGDDVWRAEGRRRVVVPQLAV